MCLLRLQEINLTTLVSSILLATILSLYLLVYLLSHFPRKPYDEELLYLTNNGPNGLLKGTLCPVTNENEDNNILLSVVVPSYNETDRILLMLTEAIEYLIENFGEKWEILIVDDGSVDGTSEYCLKLASSTFNLKPDKLRVIKLTKNRGKGGAVRHGLLHIRGKYGLFADADGASKFSDVERLFEYMNGKDDAFIAIGSRSHMINTDAVVKRSFIRNFLMYGLHVLLFIFGIRSIKDTQCGFKLFNRKAILEIFPYLHNEGWIFDVEVLILAIRKKIPIKEIAISWHEVGGSKMDLAIDSIGMAKDLIVIRMAYFLGIYNDSVKC